MRQLISLFLFVLAAFALSQDVAPKAVLKLDKPTAVAGSTVKGKIIVTFEPELHAYQNPPTVEYQIPVSVTAPKGLKLVKVTYPKGAPFLMPGESEPSMVYQGSIEIPVQVKIGVKTGKTKLKLVIDYQQCNQTACFPPGKLEVSAPLTIVKKS